MKKLHKTGIAIMAALAPAAAAGVTAGVLISMNKESSGEDQKVKKADFGKQYDKLCEAYTKLTFRYTKNDLSNFVFIDSESEIYGVEYLSDAPNAFKVFKNEGNYATFDLPHILGDQTGVMAWNDIAQYFGGEDASSYTIKSDGGIEYTTTDSAAAIVELKANKFGYITSVKIIDDQRHPEKVSWYAITYLRDPS